MGDKIAPELIELNVYRFDDGGIVKSLAYKTSEGKDATHGVIIPGTTKKFDFGVAKRREEIFVVQGMLAVNGQQFGVFNRRLNTTIVFEPGEQIMLECQGPAAYNCVYG